MTKTETTKRHRPPDEKRKRGRPKMEVDLAQVERMAALGLTEKEISLVLGVSLRSVGNWKRDEDFSAYLTKGKLQADLRVIESLHKRATGYDFQEITREPVLKISRGGKKRALRTQLVVTKIVTKHIPPETLACNSWLNNRRRQDWQWQPKPQSGFADDEMAKLRSLISEAMREAI